MYPIQHCTNNTYLGCREGGEGRVPRRVPQRWTKAETCFLSLSLSFAISSFPRAPPRTISILLRCITCLFTATRSNFLLAVLLALIKMEEGERERERGARRISLSYISPFRRSPAPIQESATRWALGCVNSPPAARERGRRWDSLNLGPTF